MTADDPDDRAPEQTTEAEIAELHDRIFDLCENYSSEAMFVVLADLLLEIIAQASSAEGVDEFVRYFRRAAREDWRKQHVDADGGLIH